VLPVLASGLLASAQGATRPPAPAGVAILAAGKAPHVCGTADGKFGATGYSPVSGVYYSNTANAWLSAPLCYPLWGNLAASAPQIVQGGGRATVVATPNQGSNSAEWATKGAGAISWQPAGTPVGGCKPTSLSCTVKLPAAGPEWQWLLFHVSMPRTYFIDSPGDLCAGQHACAGASTQAWAYVGIPPKGARPSVPPATPRGKPICVPSDCSSLRITLGTTLGSGRTGLGGSASCGGSRATSAQLPDTPGTTCDVSAALGSTGKAAPVEEALRQVRAGLDDLTSSQKSLIEGIKNDALVDQIGKEFGKPRLFDGSLADRALAPLFPPGPVRATQAVTNRRAVSLSTATAPRPADVINSIAAAHPTAASVSAFASALRIATAPTSSSSRGLARLELAAAYDVGLRQLRRDGFSPGRVTTLGTTSLRIPNAAKRTITISASPFGSRIIRILTIAGISQHATTRLQITATRGGKTAAITRILVVR